MGLLDLFKRSNANTEVVRSALDEARSPGKNPDAVTTLIQRILAVGVDGAGPFHGAVKVAGHARDRTDDSEKAVDWVARDGIRNAAGAGFVTSLGGFVTMPVSLPANVFTFYVLATRAVAAVASLRGYDVKDPVTRSAILLTLVGAKSTDVLSKAGINVSSHSVTALASKNLPESALMVINKAVGFQLLKGVGQRLLARFGKAIPVLGGGIGAVLDGAMMATIVERARVEFPVLRRSSLDL